MLSKNNICLEKFNAYNFKRLAKQSKHPRERIRFLALAHLKDGKTIQEAANAVKVSRNAVYVWLRNFNKHELEGLKEKKGRGAKLKLPASETEAFRKAVLELQAGRRGGRIKGQDVLNLMKNKFGVICSPRSVYNHLKRAHLVWVSARSQHPDSDPIIQEDFKKNF